MFSPITMGARVSIRSLLLLTLINFVMALKVFPGPRHEMQEADFLDLVEREDTVLVQARGLDALHSKALRQGLAVPALGYWSVEGLCFEQPARGLCNGVFQR